MKYERMAESSLYSKNSSNCRTCPPKIGVRQECLIEKISVIDTVETGYDLVL